MPVVIANLPCKSRVEFDSGLFDNWCVYLCRPNQPRFAPKDTEYFSILKNLGLIYGSQRIYDDFVKVYNLTTASVNSAVIELIIQLSKSYGGHNDEICIWFTVLYAGMIAEENKQKAILKKRIKRLGLHQVLIDNLEPGYAANFSKEKNWRELDRICKSKKF